MKCARCGQEFELPKRQVGIGSETNVCGGCADELRSEQDAIAAQYAAESEAEEYAKWRAEQLASLEEPELMDRDR